MQKENPSGNRKYTTKFNLKQRRDMQVIMYLDHWKRGPKCISQERGLSSLYIVLRHDC